MSLQQRYLTLKATLDESDTDQCEALGVALVQLSQKARVIATLEQEYGPSISLRVEQCDPAWIEGELRWFFDESRLATRRRISALQSVNVPVEEADMFVAPAPKSLAAHLNSDAIRGWVQHGASVLQRQLSVFWQRILTMPTSTEHV